MRLAKTLCVLAVGLMVVACEHALSPNPQAAAVIRAGAPNIDVSSYPLSTYDRTDGSQCHVYRIYQSGAGVARQGTATVCRYQNERWILVARNFEPLPGSPVPVISPPGSVPVIVPQPAPPSPGTGTGWQPITN